MHSLEKSLEFNWCEKRTETGLGRWTAVSLYLTHTHTHARAHTHCVAIFPLCSCCQSHRVIQQTFLLQCYHTHSCEGWCCSRQPIYWYIDKADISADTWHFLIIGITQEFARFCVLFFGPISNISVLSEFNKRKLSVVQSFTSLTQMKFHLILLKCKVEYHQLSTMLTNPVFPINITKGQHVYWK